MALQHISEVRTPPCAIVSCSDSRSALSSIRSDSTSAREDLVLEIGTVVHQLITRGTEVRFQWVPAHVCLSGNELADRAAKRGARRLEFQTLQLKLGLADIYSKLPRRVWRKREEDFRAQATAKEWLDPSPPSRDGVFFPGVPTYLARIMWIAGGPCLCLSLVYTEERYPSTMSYLTAESARLTSRQPPVV